MEVPPGLHKMNQETGFGEKCNMSLVVLDRSPCLLVYQQTLRSPRLDRPE